MKSFRIRVRDKTRRGAFSLAEATFSIGVLSFGLLSLAPMLALGLKASRQARNDRASAQIAETTVEEARQGTLTPGYAYFDDTGAALPSPQMASFAAQTTTQTSTQSAALTQMTLKVTPLGAPDRMRVYAVVYQTPGEVP
jgi:uncharacterized protein (TIGR02598 family)